MEKLKVGTLINDNDKLGVITKIIEVGTLDVEVDIINWRANYEVHYTDGVVAVLGCKTVERLVKEEKIKIVYRPTTPLPHSSSEQLVRDVIQLQEKDNPKKRRSKCGAKKERKKDQ
tara:strand:+ start:948 stop:1295 length:348 start_codon:yes stop_codon:yes gene_type:complete